MSSKVNFIALFLASFSIGLAVSNAYESNDRITKIEKKQSSFQDQLFDLKHETYIQKDPR